MFYSFQLLCLLLSLICFQIEIYSQGTDYPKPSDSKVTEWMSKASETGFLENNGQIADAQGNKVPFVLFESNTPNFNFWITDYGITMITSSSETGHASINSQNNGNLESIEMVDSMHWERIDIKLKGASIKKENILKEYESTSSYNYLLGHCSKGVYGVKGYKKITVKNVYPGIDWIIYKTSSGDLKYDFVVHPNAHHETIELIYCTKNPLIINEYGLIELQTSYGVLKENKPVSFLGKDTLNTLYIKKNENHTYHNYEKIYETCVSFKLENEKFIKNGRIEDLIIDPQISWYTLFGGNVSDVPYSLEADVTGNLICVGATTSANFPVLNSGGSSFFSGTYATQRDAFIVKFSPSGVLIWTTYFGGSTEDSGQSVDTDNAGNIFVIGTTTSLDLPTFNSGGGNYFQGVNLGANDVFILKFDSNSQLLWSTYYGGAGSDYGFSITCTPNDEVVALGSTYSLNFPLINPGGGAYFQPISAGSQDIFIAKFSNSGAALWSTFYGGSNNEAGFAINADLTGNILLTGYSQSTNFPLQNSIGAYFQNALAGASDAIIVKFNSSGTLLWSTYYGGFNDDEGGSIITDAANNIFISGQSNSTNLPLLNPGGVFFQGSLGGGQDCFLVKLSDQNSLEWATYLGGTGFEVQLSFDNLTFDNCENIFVSLASNSTNLVLTQPCDFGYFDNTPNGGTDIYLALFSNDGELFWSTLLGGSSNDRFESIAFGVNNELNVAHGVNSTVSVPANASSLPLVDLGNGAYFDATFNGPPTINGNHDVAFVKIVPIPESFVFDVVQPTCSNPCDGAISLITNNS